MAGRRRRGGRDAAGTPAGPSRPIQLLLLVRAAPLLLFADPRPGIRRCVEGHRMDVNVFGSSRDLHDKTTLAIRIYFISVHAYLLDLYFLPPRSTDT
jgi:hypothetical protein